jgi:kynurenine formamidase
MRPIDLSIPLGIGTPAWPTYEPLEMKYFKRLAPNGANGQLLTHSNHVGTHLDGEIHFYTPGKDIAALSLDYLMHEGAIVDLSDAAGDYDVYTSAMVEERVEVREGDILIIHTGYHHYGWTSRPPTRSVTWSSTPDRTASSPSGAERRSSAGWGSTAAAPTTP